MPAFPIRRPALRALLVSGCAIGLFPFAPVHAQGTVESRVDRIEQELRAVQRKVFPGGAGQLVSPDVAPATTPTAPTIGSPASSPVADLTAKVGAIESQLARLTGQVEENQFRIKQLEEANTKLTAALQNALATPAPTPPAALAVSPTTTPATPKPTPATTATSTATTQPKPTTATPAKPTATATAKPTTAAASARVQAVAAVEKPDTGNAALDSYTYGFRLWSAKFYPEAQTQLQATLDKYGSSDVASRTQNLLGRAYLDDGKAATAAKVLFENYRLRPKGERAAESLAWVGEALIQLNRLKDACLAYDELRDGFGTNIPESVRAMMEKGRVRAKCSA